MIPPYDSATVRYSIPSSRRVAASTHRLHSSAHSPGSTAWFVHACDSRSSSTGVHHDDVGPSISTTSFHHRPPRARDRSTPHSRRTSRLSQRQTFMFSWLDCNPWNGFSSTHTQESRVRCRWIADRATGTKLRAAAARPSGPGTLPPWCACVWWCGGAGSRCLRVGGVWARVCVCVCVVTD